MSNRLGKREAASGKVDQKGLRGGWTGGRSAWASMSSAFDFGFNRLGCKLADCIGELVTALTVISPVGCNDRGHMCWTKIAEGSDPGEAGLFARAGTGGRRDCPSVSWPFASPRKWPTSGGEGGPGFGHCVCVGFTDGLSISWPSVIAAG